MNYGTIQTPTPPQHQTVMQIVYLRLGSMIVIRGNKEKGDIKVPSYIFLY